MFDFALRRLATADLPARRPANRAVGQYIAQLVLDRKRKVGYDARMTKRMDGRTRRGLVRRAAYADAARAFRLADLHVSPVANTGALIALQFRERERLLEWLEARARGELRKPPGGTR